ncbi:tyrosine-type recombinase/integrase [Noviherbaspirillum sp. Root189]|uniref:tyrosine-type recombinase/integrase n=1 Tax=Noviherbaspirillum sp. Root189 TaxID=1736487 RepID=UPI0009ECABB5|nr:tyrosine-type recombinase/integrase [Noviherbaspirillum sp. Root189]
MLEHLFPVRHAQYQIGAAAPVLEQFAAWLIDTGYSRLATQGHVQRLKRVLAALQSVPQQWSSAELDRAFSAVSGQPRPLRATATLFKQHLKARGQWALDEEHGPFTDMLARYERHLAQMRGLAAHTVHKRLAIAHDFLAREASDDASLHGLSSEAVERYLESVSPRLARPSLQQIITQLRSFLRFCHDQGLTERRLDAIDCPRIYRDESMPRAIDWPLVEALLRSVDRSDKTGQRDYTILFLMSHLGLRPSEVVALRLESIDWHTATLRVEQRKTRSQLVLPLSKAVCHVLRTYLRNGRPQSDLAHLFLRALFPQGPISASEVGTIFASRVKRSGLSINTTAPYSLRHSFAMRLLERGVNVKTIGDLLGHHSLRSTCVYLRLDVEALRCVGLPLPRRGHCAA